RHPFDLVEVLDHRLAALERHDLGELAVHGADAGGDLVQQARLLEARYAAPPDLRLARGAGRGGDVGRLRAGDAANDLLGRWVLDLHGRATRRAAGGTVHPHPDLGHGEALLRSPANGADTAVGPLS